MSDQQTRISIVFEMEQAMRPDDKKLCESCLGSGQFIPPTSRGVVVNAECPQCGGTGLRKDEVKHRLMVELREHLEEQLFKKPNDEEKKREIARGAIYEAAEEKGMQVSGFDIEADPYHHIVEIKVQLVAPADYIIMDLK